MLGMKKAEDCKQPAPPVALARFDPNTERTVPGAELYWNENELATLLMEVPVVLPP